MTRRAFILLSVALMLLAVAAGLEMVQSTKTYESASRVDEPNAVVFALDGGCLVIYTMNYLPVPVTSPPPRWFFNRSLRPNASVDWWFRWKRDQDGLVVAIPLWFVVLIAGGSSILAFKRGRRTTPPNVCAKCGYDLRATPDRCPECGTARG